MLSSVVNYVRNKSSEMSLTAFLQGRAMMLVGKWSQTSCFRCSHSGAFIFAQVSTANVELYLTSFSSQWPRTLGAVFQISHHQSPRSQPHSSHFRIEMFCLPNSAPYLQSAAFPRFLTEFCSKGQTAGLGRSCWFAAARCKAAGKIEELAHRHFYLIRCEIFADSTAMY
jgi:hypothetical protein